MAGVSALDSGFRCAAPEWRRGGAVQQCRWEGAAPVWRQKGRGRRQAACGNRHL